MIKKLQLNGGGEKHSVKRKVVSLLIIEDRRDLGEGI